jgi:enoyl-CoA hydratase
VLRTGRDGVAEGAHLSVRGVAAVVTMDWPSKRNALRPDDARAIAAAIEGAAGTDAVGLVLTGSTAFCAGGDLPYFLASAADDAGTAREQFFHDVYDGMQGVLRALHDTRLLTVAAVDGPAIGLGMDFALACDVCVVGDGGWMQQGWAKVGLIAATGGIHFLDQVAPGLLWDLLDQRRLTAEDCVRLRLARRAAIAVDEAVGIVERIADVGPEALAEYVALNRLGRWPSHAEFEAFARAQARLLAGGTFRQRAGAVMAQRRSAHKSGR